MSSSNAERVNHVCALQSCGSEATQVCSKCKKQYYCTQEHQLTDWKLRYRAECHKPDVEVPKRPSVLHIDIEEQIESFNMPLINSVKKASIYSMTTTIDSTIRAIEASPPPFSILVTSFGEKRAQIISALKLYCKKGGRVIIGGSQPSWLTMPQVDKLFKVFGLPWTHWGYHRSNHTVLSTHPLFPTFNPPLIQQYSMKSLFLKNVPEKDAVYRPPYSATTTTQSHVFPAVQVDREETPVAMGRCGDGWFGWVGDVNAEEGTRRVTLGLLGLNTA